MHVHAHVLWVLCPVLLLNLLLPLLLLHVHGFRGRLLLLLCVARCTCQLEELW